MMMKNKILSFALFTLLVSTRAFAESSSTVELIGLGMKPEIVKYLTSNGVIQKNNTSISFANATPAATALAVMKLDASNNVVINAISGKTIKLQNAGTPIASINSSGISSGPNSFVITAPTAIQAQVGTTPIIDIKSVGIISDLNTLVIAAPTQIGIAAGVANTPEINLQAAKLQPVTDNNYNLGDSTHSFRSLWLGNQFAYGSGGLAGQSFRTVPYVPTMAATPIASTNVLVSGYNVIPTAAANTAALLDNGGPNAGDWVFGYNSNSANSVRLSAGTGVTINGAASGGYLVVAAKGWFECKANSITDWNCTLPALPTPQGP